MKYYFINLWHAILGRDPWEEINNVREECENIMAWARKLNETYYDFLNATEQTEKKLISYQVLTENLRQRLNDKDEQIIQMRQVCKMCYDKRKH